MSSLSATPRFSVLTRFLPYAALLSAMLSFSIGASFAKSLFPLIGPEATAAYRVTVSSVLLLAIWRPWRFRFNRRTLGMMALYGGSVGGMNLLFFMALARLPLGVALSIEFTGPLTLALLHARRPIHFVWVALAITGLCLLLPFNGLTQAIDPIGVALALAAGVFWALYIVFGKRLAHVHAGQSVSIGMSIAAGVILPFGLFHAGTSLFNPAFLPLGLAVGLLSSAIPYSLEMFAMRHIPERSFGVMTSADPVLGALSGLIFMHEHLTGLQWLAIAAIVTAAAGTVATSTPEAPATNALPAE